MTERNDYAQFEALPKADRLSELSKMAEALRLAEAQAAQIQEQLAAAQAQIAELSERQIPELMDQLGMAEFKLKGGATVAVVKSLSVTLPPATKEAAHDWLEANGHSGLIKRKVEVSFTREQQDRARSLATQLKGEYDDVKMDRKVEPSTLKAFVAGLLKDGKPVPTDLINVHERRVAKIDLPKTKK